MASGSFACTNDPTIEQKLQNGKVELSCFRIDVNYDSRLAVVSTSYERPSVVLVHVVASGSASMSTRDSSCDDGRSLSL